MIVVLGVVCLVLFVTGVFSPSKSKRMQNKVDSLARKGEKKGDDKGGKFGDAMQDALKKSRKAADASARAGRRVHEKATSD